MTTYIISADASIPAKVALAALQDSPHLCENAVIVQEEETPWASEVQKAFGLNLAKGKPYYTLIDTLVGPPDEKYVRYAADAGSTYLDISSGLVAIALVDEEEVPESPDTEVLPEPKPERKPAEKKAPAKKRAARKPLPNIPPAASERVTKEQVERPKAVSSDTEAPVKAAQTPSAPVVTKETHSREDLLRQLVASLLETASEDMLWSVAETLRSK